MKKFVYKENVLAANFITGMMVGIEFPPGESWGDYDDGEDFKETLWGSFVLDLFIIRICFHRFYTTEEPEEEFDM